MRSLPKTAVLFLTGLSIITMSAPNLPGASNDSAHTNYFVYAGTYGKGVYGYRFDEESGKLEAMGIAGEVTNPSFVIADQNNRFLYAVSELEGGVNGGVASFAIDRKSGNLRFLNSQSSAGVAPCHLALDRTGKMLMVANYGTGSVSVFPIEPDGRLGKMSALLTAHGSSINQKRQRGPHAHEVVLSSDNRFAYVPDLGLDQIRIYRVDPAHASLTPSDPPFAKQEPGMGPRHMALSPNKEFAYVVNELKSFVTVFSHDPADGTLRTIENVSTLPGDYSGDNAPAEIEVDRAGKFLYATNRGADSIAVFAIDQGNGLLKRIQVVSSEGNFPRGFVLDPTGHYAFVGNQKSNDFAIFRVDPKTGHLSFTGEKFQAPSPVSFQFVPME